MELNSTHIIYVPSKKPLLFIGMENEQENGGQCSRAKISNAEFWLEPVDHSISLLYNLFNQSNDKELDGKVSSNEELN